MVENSSDVRRLSSGAVVCFLKSMDVVFVIPWFPTIFGILLNFGEAFGQAPHMAWKTVYSLEEEHQIAKGSLLTTIPKLTDEWRLSFEVNPTEFTIFGSVLHMTIGAKGGKVGDRIPAIWFHRTKGILISTAFRGRASHTIIFKQLPTTYEWTKFELSQSFVQSQLMFNITIGGKNVFYQENTKPVELENVKVYSGNPWNPPQKGLMRNLAIEMNTPPPCIPPGKPFFNF